MGILTSIIVFMVLIFVHELGHFMLARFHGVRVEVFSIGFGKVLWERQFADTKWRISLIPLGGFVKMKGQNDLDVTEKDSDDDSYSVKHPWQKISILLAGPFFNFLLALLLYIVIGFLGMERLAPQVGRVLEKSPASAAGLQKGDTLIKIVNNDIKTWDDISDNMAVIASEGMYPITVDILRNGEKKRLVLVPKIMQTQNIFGETIYKPMIGIAPSGKRVFVQYDLLQTMNFAAKRFWHDATLIVTGLKKLILGVIPLDNLGGVVSIVQVTSKASDYGLVTLLLFTALISVNLGIVNLLPIPALDGGHIMLNIYELIRGKAPSDENLKRITIVGWGILLSLLALGLYNDISRITRDGF